MNQQRNWKTTVCGIVSLIGSQVSIFYPEHSRDGAFVSSVATGVGLMLSSDAPPGPRNWRAAKATVVAALVFVGIFLLSGCAVVKQTATTTTTNPTNGVVTVNTATSSIMASGDSKTIVDKVRASAGKTSSVGAQGVSEESTTAGLAELLKLLQSLRQP